VNGEPPNFTNRRINKASFGYKERPVSGLSAQSDNLFGRLQVARRYSGIRFQRNLKADWTSQAFPFPMLALLRYIDDAEIRRTRT
jgi:hypothetical protein